MESGFRSCWDNVDELLSASKSLLDGGHHALALSLAVLCIEEMAKLHAIDGLLYARPGDYKDGTFREALKSHESKLAIFQLFPLFLRRLAELHPKYDDDFESALIFSLQMFKREGMALIDQLGDGGFGRLDKLKQDGFYVGLKTGQPITPRKAIAQNLAQLVYQVAWRATTTLDFVLKAGGLEEYIRNAREIRSKLSEDDHRILEEEGEARFRELFNASGDESG